MKRLSQLHSTNICIAPVLPDTTASAMSLVHRTGVVLTAFACLAITGCETLDPYGPDRAAAAAAIRSEIPGNYFVGRRFYKRDYKMWGWVREPGHPWKSAKLVMLNEQRRLAPDREQGALGADNNYEYRLEGFFSGETVYEPASNRFYPEFVLTGYQLLSTTPHLIFKERRSIEPSVRLLTPPL
jgi:hypothetical protein